MEPLGVGSGRTDDNDGAALSGFFASFLEPFSDPAPEGRVEENRPERMPPTRKCVIFNGIKEGALGIPLAGGSVQVEIKLSI